MSNCRPANGNQPWPLSCALDGFGALLFDLDGTLVDTMPLHCLAYAQVFAARGYTFTMNDYLDHVGPPAAITIPAFAAAVGMPPIDDAEARTIHQEKKQRFRALLETKPVPTLPASGLLDRYHGQIPMAIVSSGNRNGVEAILRNLGWLDLFGGVITGDDVEQGKPHPEPFLLGAEALGVAPERCVVLEDTQSGIAGARAAGMSVIDVTVPGALIAAGDGQ